MRKRIFIAKIGKTHGLRGELSIRPFLPAPEFYEQIGHVSVETVNGIEILEIDYAKLNGKKFILKFKDFNTIESVDKFRGSIITVERSKLADLPAGEYYRFDIIGMKAVSEQTGEDIGKIIDIIETGANDVYVVKDSNDMEILVPALKEVVREIDIDKNEMKLRFLKGMIEENRI